MSHPDSSPVERRRSAYGQRIPRRGRTIVGIAVCSAALALACVYDHPVYDFIYLEAARRHDAVLLTADDRLARKLAGSADGSILVRLADWRAE